MPQERSAFAVSLGRVLKARRAEVGASQDEISRRSGVARSYLSACETGATNVTVLNLRRICEALNISLSELLARAEKLADDEATHP